MAQTSTPALRVRINYIDHILAPPSQFDNLRGKSLSRVPVIRIFGDSSTGQNACVHVHQVFPYFFVEYTGSLKPSDVNQYIARLSVSMDHAIAISLKRNPNSKSSKFVRAIFLVKGVHFYGFHSSYTPFLKICMADPTLMSRTVTIMQSGTVMKTAFQVYESHLSFPLQFMCDFALYGCGWLDLGSEIFQRGRGEDSVEVHLQVQTRSNDNGDKANENEYDGDRHSNDHTHIRFQSSPLYAQSRLPLELDVSAHQILNRHALCPRNLHHQLRIPAPPLPSEPLVISVRELWEDERKRRRELGLCSNPEIPVELSERSRGKGGDWAAEARWWDEIRTRIERERVQVIQEEEHGGKDDDWTRWVMTTFESVEYLWESKWRKWRPSPQQERQQANTVTTVEPTNPFDESTIDPGKSDKEEVDIDTMALSSQDMSGNAIALPDQNEGDKQADTNGDQEIEDAEDPFSTPKNSPRKTQGLTLSTRRLDFATPTKNKRFLDGAESPSATPTKRSKAQPDDDDDTGMLVASTSHHSEPSLSQHHSSQLTTSVGLSTQATLRPGVTFFATQSTARSYEYSIPPPTTSLLLSTLGEYDIPARIYQEPYYSNASDAPARAREFAGVLFKLKGGTGVATLEPFHEDAKGKGKESDGSFTITHDLDGKGVGGWEYAAIPPSLDEIRRWLAKEKEQQRRFLETGNAAKDDKVSRGGMSKPSMQSQIEGPTQLNVYGLKSTPIGLNEKNFLRREKQNMTVLSLEIFAASREDLLPNPDTDSLLAAFYAFQSDNIEECTGGRRYYTGIIALDDPQLNPKRLRDISARTNYETVETELDLLNRIIDVTVELDPDIVVGWEVQNYSWSYVQARGAHYGLDVAELISRAPSNPHKPSAEQWAARTQSTFQIVGRHVLNIWRIMRAELALTSYTFENVVFHVLGQRTPRYSPATLTSWYQSPYPSHTSRMMRYFAKRTSLNLTVLEEAEIVSKNAEFARVFGVDFFSVLTRGSQFKVESFMFRIAKPESFVLLSPSKAEVGSQNAAECMPLIMEPMSAFYNSPLVVLDFQSLYPSIMIAYNYCYSTCIGRVTDFQGRPKFGVTDVPQPAGLVEKLVDNIQVSPNGLMYVKPNVRKGLLAKMLTELLDTRVMVKQAMKSAKGDKALKRILNARQLGLKYIANVTYGYTSATYSGRMPAVEIADSIVQSGRETLEKAIQLIDSTKKWGAKVVYGDTDSLFIYLRGKTKEQAFRIGYEMAETVTAMNPAPVKLKFEKVYLPCVLMAKKRYVGFKYETPDEVEPVFDAKGIETVRRDGVPAQSKMVENCLKILFRTQDLSKVKAYCCRSWTKILEGKASLQDFIFAKEVRMGTYSDKVPPQPGVMVAARRQVMDEYDEAQYGERVPYVITRGEGKARLVERAVTPLEFLENRQLKLDGVYYITRVLIPPLERIFNLVGADVRRWYDEMPRSIKSEQTEPTSPSKRRQAPEVTSVQIEDHFSSSHCLICNAPDSDGLCEACESNPQTTLSTLLERLRNGEERLINTRRICSSCTGDSFADEIKCESLDCPWFFERVKVENKMEFVQTLHEMVDNLATVAELDIEQPPDTAEISDDEDDEDEDD